MHFIIMAILAIILLFVSARLRYAQRAEYINSFALPPGIFERLQKRRPELSLKDCQLVNKGLHQFFLAYLKSGRRHVSMPSQVADDLWHEFILYTRQYDRFCRKAFGGFFHHTPAVALKTSRRNNAGLRRCWWHACKDELINPRKPVRLPLLFALDAKLNIAGGFHYVPDCSSVRREDNDGSIVYCGGDFSDSAIDGSLDGFDFADSSGSSDSGCSGDGGCGGGCGGD